MANDVDLKNNSLSYTNFASMVIIISNYQSVRKNNLPVEFIPQKGKRYMCIWWFRGGGNYREYGSSTGGINYRNHGSNRDRNQPNNTNF